MIRNHVIQSLDLIGTCYDILTKPLPLMQRHIDIYRHKVINKKSLMANESMDEEAKLDLEIPIDDPN